MRFVSDHFGVGHSWRDHSVQLFVRRESDDTCSGSLHIIDAGQIRASHVMGVNLMTGMYYYFRPTCSMTWFAIHILQDNAFQ